MRWARWRDDVSALRRLRGSVRLRTTLSVTALFAAALTVAAVLFIGNVRRVLVEDSQAGDREAVEELRAKIIADGKLPATLTPSVNRPQAQLQLVDSAGQVLASTPGADTRPFVASGQWRPPLDANGNPLPGPFPGVPPGSRPPFINGPGPVGEFPNGAPVGAPPGGGSGVPPGAPPGGTNRPIGVPGGGPIGVPGAGPIGVPGGLPNGVPGTLRPPYPQVPYPQVPYPQPQSQVLPANRLNNPPRSNSPLLNVDWAVTSVALPTDLGEVSIIAASPLSEVSRSIDTLAQTLWFAIPSLVALVGCLAWWVTGRALRPVHAITQRVADISAASLHERVPEPGSDDEVGELARTMNEMLSRLENADLRQRQFVSDASHELRSPVASIRTELEVALLTPDATNWREVADSVLAEDARLDRIVGDLLTLARLGEQTDPGVGADVDLDDVMLAEAARTRRLAIDTSAVVPARTLGRAEELARMAGHLLDNAARHARTRVEAGVGHDPMGRPILWVDDDGAGVPVDQRTSIFDRFGRLDEGRARDQGGAGLGLAVVRRIAERHGGTVEVTDSPLGGARFLVRLPAG